MCYLIGYTQVHVQLYDGKYAFWQIVPKMLANTLCLSHEMCLRKFASYQLPNA